MEGCRGLLNFVNGCRALWMVAEGCSALWRVVTIHNLLDPLSCDLVRVRVTELVEPVLVL